MKENHKENELEDLHHALEEALGTKLIPYRRNDEAAGVVGLHLIPKEEEKLAADWDQRTERQRVSYYKHFETCPPCSKRFNEALARKKTY